MHQKYTLTVADIEINVISDESPEAVEALVVFGEDGAFLKEIALMLVERKN